MVRPKKIYCGHIAMTSSVKLLRAPLPQRGDVVCTRRVSIVAEQLLRLLQYCGAPPTDVDLVHGDGRVVSAILKQGQPRSTLFTGSQAVGEQLVIDLKGKVRVWEGVLLALGWEHWQPPSARRRRC